MDGADQDARDDEEWDGPLVQACVENGRLAARLSVARALALGMGLAAAGATCAAAWFASHEPTIILRAAASPKAPAPEAGPGAAADLAVATIARSFEGGWKAEAAGRLRFTPEGAASLDEWEASVGAGPGRTVCVQVSAAPKLASEGTVSGLATWTFDVPVRIWRSFEGKASVADGHAAVVVVRSPGVPGGLAVSAIASSGSSGK
jgi:hypothetical protein